MIEKPLERDRCCGNCKHLKFSTRSKSCNVKGLKSAGLSYADCCEKYQFNKDEIYQQVYVDKEKDCYFYRFTINGQEKMAYADTMHEIMEIIYKLNNIESLLKTKETIGTMEFLKFMRKELPDVYRNLRREFSKRKGFIE